jgi:hypothetical protein
MTSGARLVLGPMLRHVGPTSATIWVETSAPAQVTVRGEGLDAGARTFTVAGHHYSLVVATGLAPGATIAYQVDLDDVRVWPLDDEAPASLLCLPAADRPVSIAFGSCRYASPPALEGAGRYGPDALDALAHRLRAEPDRRPDLLLLLGDQVYADEPTPRIQGEIAARRGDSEPRGEVADFEEYTWLYHESWTDPDLRWLFSTVPTAMIFDDHDVHDDWNTSGSWRRMARATSWWDERIIAALESYFVYQHLGNLSPADLDADPTYRRILELPPGQDAEPILRELAIAADAEADPDPDPGSGSGSASGVDGHRRGRRKGYRWSFVRELGRTRVVVLDSRCGRILDGPHREMLADVEFDWLADQLRADYDHLVIGTSLPWLLPPLLHDLEAWDERLAASPGRARAALGERLRQTLDLEHWAAFQDSFTRLAGLLGRLAHGRLGRPAPSSISVLSGDVHHSYVARAFFPRRGVRGSARTAAPVHQITCSPLHNVVSLPMRWLFRFSWSTAITVLAGVIRRLGGVPFPPMRWRRVGGGPWLGNALGTLALDGVTARLVLETSEQPDGAAPLRELLRVRLTPPPGRRQLLVQPAEAVTGGDADQGKTIQRSVRLQA